MSSARSSVTARLFAAVGLQTFSAPPPPQLQGARAGSRPRPLAREGLAPAARRPEMAICGAPRASSLFPPWTVAWRLPWLPWAPRNNEVALGYRGGGEQAHGPYVGGAAFLRRDEFGPCPRLPPNDRWFATFFKKIHTYICSFLLIPLRNHNSTHMVVVVVVRGLAIREDGSQPQVFLHLLGRLYVGLEEAESR